MFKCVECFVECFFLCVDSISFEGPLVGVKAASALKAADDSDSDMD